MATQTLPASEKLDGKRPTGLRTNQPVNTYADLLEVTDGLLEEMGLDRRDTGGQVTFAGLDPLRPTVLKTGASSATIAAAGAIASAILWRLRGGEGHDIHIDLRKAYTYQSPWQDVLNDCTQINGTSVMVLPSYGPGIYFLPTRDNRFVMVLPEYPSQHLKTYELFRCGLVYDQMARVARRWDAEDLEAAGQDLALPISMVRTQDEFQASDHWQYHASTPLIHIEKIGESAPEPLPPEARPKWHCSTDYVFEKGLSEQKPPEDSLSETCVSRRVRRASRHGIASVPQ